MQRVFVMIKPELVQSADAVLAELDSVGRRETTACVECVPIEIIGRHYIEKLGRPYFFDMLWDFEGKRVVIATYSGEQRAFDFTKTRLRERYSPLIMQPQTHKRNGLHISDSPQEAEREIAIWRKYLWKG